ncbi:MAG TPA: PQQ-binding-like beta-propeller repeat protein [Gemmataceae bacterium]|nr:PQQ-binding-like beta-propeller repeat protein [Gemmataceae bacterium]
MRRILRAAVYVAFLACSATSFARADDWPQWLGPRRDGIWRESGILDKFPAGGPKELWKTPIGAGYAGPAVAHGHVFVTDHVLAPGAKYPASGFSGPVVEGKERVLCLDEKTGAEVWKHEYDCAYKQLGYCKGPRTTPTIHEGKVYTLGAMGHLFCLDEKTGKPIWSKELMKDYGAPLQTWGFSASPLIDGNKLICLVGGKGSNAVAFDKDTGKELWRAVDGDVQGYCPPTIVQGGGKRQLIIWDPQAVHSLDPETGREYWSEPWSIQAGMTIPNPRQTGDKLLVSCFYNGSIMFKLDAEVPAAKVLWKGKGKGVMSNQTDGLHAVMPAPFIKDGFVYGTCSYGQLRCLEADTGKRIWETFKAAAGKEERWGNAFLVPQGDRFFIFNEKGDLIIAKLTPKGYEEMSRAHVIEPTNTMAPGSDKDVPRAVVWVHPAFADKSMFVRNDKEIIRVSLAE